jgi:Zn-finger nucleic acid-binding protein
MHCVSDKTILIKKTAGSFGVHACTTCSGVWLGLQDFTLLEPPGGLQRRHTHRPGERLCPKCTCRMEIWKVHGIEVDVCNSCRGVWFDKGELQKLLRQRKQSQTANALTPGKSNSSGSALEYLDLVPDGIELLGEILVEIADKSPELAGELASAVLSVIFEVLSGL